MQAATRTVSYANTTIWTGRVSSALAVLFLVFDGVIKVMVLPPVVDSFAQLGYATELAVGIGVLELLCIAVYVLPRTSVLGAVLLTGYLGGAIASHVRADSELFSLVFPIIIGALLWGGLYLRDARVRAMTRSYSVAHNG
jgi:DoxX-like family